MQLAHCCEIFDIFIFILVLPRESVSPVNSATLFHRVFAGVSLFVFNSLPLLL